MRELTSGVYYVDYQKIQTFLDHAKKSGWDWGDDVDVYAELAEYTTKKSIIPFTLDCDGNRIGYWHEYICDNKSKVLEEMNDWTDWTWTDKYIEYYKPNVVL